MHLDEIHIGDCRDHNGKGWKLAALFSSTLSSGVGTLRTLFRWTRFSDSPAEALIAWDRHESEAAEILDARASRGLPKAEAA